jgi:hypothetical protein
MIINEKKCSDWRLRFQIVSLLALFLIFNCCSMTKKSQGMREKSDAKSDDIPINKNSGLDKNNQTIDPVLIKILQEQYDMQRLFAWCGTPLNGRVMFLDNQNKVHRCSFIFNNKGYHFSPDVEIEKKDKPFSIVLDEKELGPAAKYLLDTELPMQADMLETGQCQAKIIFLWQAVQRKIDINFDIDDIRELAWSAIRVIVTKKGRLISNSVYEFDATLPQDILVADINGDGKTDYAFAGGMQSTDLYIWTLTNSCKLQPLPFLIDDEGTKRRVKSLNSHGAQIKKEGSGYTIHTSNKAILSQVYKKEIYNWSTTQKAFVRTPLK